MSERAQGFHLAPFLLLGAPLEFYPRGKHGNVQNGANSDKDF